MTTLVHARTDCCVLLAATFSFAGSIPAFANSSENTAVLAASPAEASGRIALNLAAGSGNQEANVALVAAGGRTATPAALVQHQANPAPAAGAAEARIADHALAGASGLIAVNVAAGNGNQLANLALIGIGIEAPVAAEPLLEQARASQQPAGSPAGSPSPEVEAGLAGSAFAGSTGLVQANVVGGERNSSSNTFALTVAGGD